MEDRPRKKLVLIDTIALLFGNVLGSWMLFLGLYQKSKKIFKKKINLI